MALLADVICLKLPPFVWLVKLSFVFTPKYPERLIRDPSVAKNKLSQGDMVSLLSRQQLELHTVNYPAYSLISTSDPVATTSV